MENIESICLELVRSNRVENREEEIIKFEDIILKPIDIDDIEVIRTLRNSENKNRTFKNIKYITKEEQEKWFENYRNNSNDKMFIINFNNKSIGTIAIYNIDNTQGVAEFGRILVKEEYRGNCIGLKATKCICKYAFENLGLNKIILEVFKDNINAFNLYKKIGFKVVDIDIVENREIVLMELFNSQLKI